MTSEMKYGLRQSILIHALIFLLLAGGAAKYGGSGNKNGANAKADDHAGILDAGNKEVQVEIVEHKTLPKDTPDAISFNSPKPMPTHKAENKGYVDRDCNGGPYYGGIGIEVGVLRDTGETVLMNPHNGYPAKRAGLLAGDFILNYNDIRGTPGTSVTVKITRNGVPMDVQVVREKICTAK